MTEVASPREQELERRLLAACNRLRGPVDPTDYKAYIFPLLFLKRISDAWDWEFQRALEGFAGDEELARHPDNFRFVLPDGCHWDEVRKLHENVGAGLQKILQRIEQTNPETLAGIFGDVQWANKEKLPEHVLIGVIDEFSTLELDPDSTPGDILGAAYEYLLKYFADESGKKAGEFFTPRPVVRLLTRILDPKEGESGHDPACGSGGMLVEMVNEVREAGGDARTLRLSGQEVSLTTAALARMNLFLHDIEDFRIIRGDTLREPKFTQSAGGLEQFDVVVANPPFGLTAWGHETWADDPYGRSVYGVPPATKGELAFVEHMLKVMRPATGRLAVVMPQGILFRSGAERNIRRAIVESGRLDAIIGLPPNLFYNTGLPACIVVARSTPRSGYEGRLLLIDASSCFVKQGIRNILRQEDLEAIHGAYASASDYNGVRVRAVEITDVAESGFDLNISRYLGRDGGTIRDPVEARRDYAAALGDAQAAREALDRRLHEVGDALLAPPEDSFVPANWSVAKLGEVADVQLGFTKGRKLTDPTQSVAYVRAANVQDGFLDLDDVKVIDATKREISKFRLVARDVLMIEGGNPEDVGRGWLWEEQLSPCIHQNSVYRARIRDADELVPEFLAYVITAPPARRYCYSNATQTSNMAHLGTARMLALPIPVPPLSEQIEIVETLEAARQVAERTRAEQRTAAAFRDALVGRVLGAQPTKLPERARTTVRRDAD